MSTYRAPVLGYSDEDDRRLVHEDLPAMDRLALRHEACRVAVAVGLRDPFDPETPWLQERLDAIDAERARRRSAPRRLRAVS